MTLVLGLKDNERLIVGKAVIWVKHVGNKQRICVDAPREVAVTRITVKPTTEAA